MQLGQFGDAYSPPPKQTLQRTVNNLASGLPLGSVWLRESYTILCLRLQLENSYKYAKMPISTIKIVEIGKKHV